MVKNTFDDEIIAGIHVPKTNLILAEFVKWFHVGIVIFTGIGWMLPWPQAWQLHLILVPIMKLHWVTNNGICFFTTLEHKLRGNPKAGSSEQGSFLHRLSSGLLGKYSPSEDVVVKASEVGMYVGWLIAALRLFVL